MKTFDEAFGMVVCVVSIEASDAAKLAAMSTQAELFERYGGLLREVRDDSRFVTLVESLVQGVAEDRLDAKSALMTMFVNGLVVGMEMEKIEIGGR